MKEVEIAAEKLLIDEKLPVFEEAVTLAMNPLYIPEQLDDYEASLAFQGALRTGGIYMIGREAQEAFYSFAPALDEYPPLPYPRLWIETRHEDGYPVPLWFSISKSGEAIYILGLAIIEREQGSVWDVLVPSASAEWKEEYASTLSFPESIYSLDEVVVSGFRFKAGEGLLQSSWTEDMRGDALVQLVESWAVTGAHLIVADRVPHVAVRLDRAQRRRMSRGAPHFGASIYFVDLAASGDVEPGASDRQYHVRWLVQGHWRRNTSGSTFVKRKGCVCSWVKPYVKGPVGAPWKGRPVYTKAVA